MTLCSGVTLTFGVTERYTQPLLSLYQELSCSPCLFGPCDEALLQVKNFSLSTQ